MVSLLSVAALAAMTEMIGLPDQDVLEQELEELLRCVVGRASNTPGQGGKREAHTL